MNRKHSLLFVTILGVCGMLLWPIKALAQAGTPKPITIVPVVGFSSISQVTATLLGAVFLIGGLLCIGYFFFGAIKYITSQGDPAKAATGRNTIRDAAIGLVLLGITYALFKIVTAIIPGLSGYFS